MAANDNHIYSYVTTTASSTAMPLYITSSNVTWGNGGNGSIGVGGGGGGGGAGGYYAVRPSPALPPAKPQTALEWLDAEVEKTCALARAA